MPEFKKEIKYSTVFVILVCVYFSDVFFKGSLLAIEDGFNYFFPMMITMSRQYKNLTFPFWNPQVFSGFPLFGSMQPGALYPFNIVLPLLFKPVVAFNLNLMLHYSLAGLFTFLYARQIGLGIFPSLLSGIVFAFLGYLPSHLIHPSIVASGTWIPLIFFFHERLRQNPDIKTAAYGSFVIAMQVFAGHPQICFYTYLLLMFSVVFHLFYLDRSKRWRFAFFSILSLGLGIVIALPQIAATYELMTMGARVKTTYEFFSSYPFPIYMIPTFLFPFFYYFGGSYGGEFWGPFPELGQEAFIGTLPFLLSLLVLTRWKKNRYVIFWGLVAFLAFVLALGDATGPLNRGLFHLPFIRSFRGPSKHIMEMSLALSILTGFGFSFLQEPEREKRLVRALIIAIVAALSGSLITFTLFREPVRDFLREYFSVMKYPQVTWARGHIPERALSMADPAIYFPMLTMSAYLACLVSLLKTRQNLRNALLLIISLMIFAEGLLYRLPVPHSDEVTNYRKELYTALAADTHGRTALLTNKISPMTALPYGISLIDGYDPLLMKDYDKLVPLLFLQTPETWQILLQNNSLLSMLNTKYVVVDHRAGNPEDVKWWITRDENNRSLPVPPMAVKPPNASVLSVYRKLASFSTFSLYENEIVLPRAYPVLALKQVDSTDELMKELFSYRINPWREAALSGQDLRELGNSSFTYGKVEIREAKPDRLTISTSFRERGFVVLADQFYPGWKAYIDGKPSKIYRTNAVLRGVAVPGGEHVIIFKYVPLHIYASMFFSGLVLLAMLLLLLRKT